MVGLIYNGIGGVEGKFHMNPFAVENIKGMVASESLPGVWSLEADKPSFFYKTNSEKSKIVLSISESDLPTAIANSMKDGEKSSHAFIISAGGVVYNLFDPKCWSYHLPKGTVGGAQKKSKESISVMLCNHGELSLRGNTLFTKDGVPYCTLSQKDAYFKGGYEKRGYHAQFTSVQMTVLKRLIDKLCADFGINKSIVDIHARGKLLKADNEFTILGAENMVEDGKGPGPALKWEAL